MERKKKFPFFNCKQAKKNEKQKKVQRKEKKLNEGKKTKNLFVFFYFIFLFFAIKENERMKSASNFLSSKIISFPCNSQNQKKAKKKIK